MRSVLRLLLPTLPFAVVACGETSSQRGGSAADFMLTAETEELYSVGEVAGQDWETFGRIANVSFDERGNLYILDAGAYRVVVVDQEGSLVRTIGSQGEGPGDFGMPATSTVLGDGRLVVYDFPFTFKVFDLDGRFATQGTLERLGATPGGILLSLPGDRLVSTGGAVIGAPRASETEDPAEPDHLRDIHVFSLDGSEKRVFHRAWNLPPTPEVEELEDVNEEGRREMTMSIARLRSFDPGLHLGVLSDGRVAVVDSMGYRVKLLAMDGTVDATVERQIAPEPVTEAIRQTERARRRAAYEAADPQSMTIMGMELDDAEFARQMIDAQKAQVEDMVFTDEIPVIADMAIDREDRIWIVRTGPGGDGHGPTDLMTADGEYLGSLPPGAIEIPLAFGPGGLLAYVETGELDVPTVRVVRLVSLER